MQDRINDAHNVLRLVEERAKVNKAELAGAAVADSLMAAIGYAKQGVVDLARISARVGVEGAKIAGSASWSFSRGFVSGVRSRGSERLQ